MNRSPRIPGPPARPAPVTKQAGSPRPSSELPLLSPRELASRASVTVRTLHHYDRIGLLKPRGRSAGGARRYGREAFVRLQQIVTLRHIGFSLREIRSLLTRRGAVLQDALQAQRRTLEEQRRHLDRAIEALSRAEASASCADGSDSEVFFQIIEALQQQAHTKTMKEYYNEEARQLLAERGALWSPELQRETEDAWASLIRDLESAAGSGCHPAGPEGQSLAARHARLIESFTGGHAAIDEGLKKLWADQENWPEDFKRQVFQPFADRGIPSAGGAAPQWLSETADRFLNQALEVYRGKK